MSKKWTEENPERVKELKREWYLKNKKITVERATVWKKQNLKQIREHVDKLKKESSCVKCGFDHPAALLFHHRNPNEKNFSIAEARGYSFKTVLKEIEKCDILCSNCHEILHWDEKHTT